MIMRKRLCVLLFTIVAMNLVLASCGGSQAPIGAPGTTPQGRAVGQGAAAGKSWMLPEAKNEDLLYVVGGCNHTCVLSYPDGKYVGNLSSTGEAVCSDAMGNVFIPFDTTVTEYAHGGTSPIQTLNLPGNSAFGCAVDPLTNNLAVAFRGSGGDVAVYQNETGNPKIYVSHIAAFYCGYDNAGNLFVDSDPPLLAELPRDSDSFIPLALSEYIGQAGQLQWDGKYMTYEATGGGADTISRLSIAGSVVTVVGTTLLKKIKRNPWQSWLYNGVVVVPYASHGSAGDTVGYWRYPKGGRPTKVIKSFGPYNRAGLTFRGVTVSVKP